MTEELYTCDECGKDDVTYEQVVERCTSDDSFVFCSLVCMNEYTAPESERSP